MAASMKHLQDRSLIEQGAVNWTLTIKQSEPVDILSTGSELRKLLLIQPVSTSRNHASICYKFCHRNHRVGSDEESC